MRKNKKGFTLIELLAIIVILAIIAVITVPLILNIIDDSKKGAAKDSSYGYKKGVENFYLSKFSQDNSFKFEDRAYTTEELKNLGLQVSGQEPNSGEVVFENNMIKSFTLEYDKYICDYSIDSDVNCNENTGLIIKSINHEATTNSINITVDLYGTPTSYEYKINDGEFETSNSNTHTFSNLENNIEYEITVKVKGDSGEASKTKKVRTESLQVGDALTYGGYNWHVIRNYEENGTTYQTILMDGMLPERMAHCTSDTDPNTDCGVDDTGEYFVYSWDKSLIQTYLNTTFIDTLKINGADTSKIKAEQICVDSSIGGNSNYSYGGYLKEEVDLVDGTCSNYGLYQIRLISASEYYNLSYYYNSTQLPYEGVIGDCYGNIGKVAKLNGIERLSETESTTWLYYDESIGNWWSMGSYSGEYDYDIEMARMIDLEGELVHFNASQTVAYMRWTAAVRPVITLIK